MARFRGVDQRRLLRQWSRHNPLLAHFRGRRPTVSDLYELRKQANVPEPVATWIDSVLTSSTPDQRLKLLLADRPMRRRLTEEFGGKFPTLADIKRRMALIDKALEQRLPHAVQVHRSLRDLAFMEGDVGDPHRLRGTTQVEPGYLSGSLGAEPAYPDVDPMDRARIRTAMSGT